VKPAHWILKRIAALSGHGQVKFNSSKFKAKEKKIDNICVSFDFNLCWSKRDLAGIGEGSVTTSSKKGCGSEENLEKGG